MLIIPAIDLKGGRCVRLRQGKAEKEEVFFDNPVAVAKRWEAQGAELIHLVDLDGAFQGRLIHFSIIKDILKNIKTPVQLGGGLRKEEDIDSSFTAGISRVILGTGAVETPNLIRGLVKKYGKKIAVAVDVSSGKLVLRGWRKKVDMEIVDFISQMKDLGIEDFIFTDVSRDGMMRGPNIKAVKDLLSKVEVKLIASGGIRDKDDLEKLKKLEGKGLVGVIIGRALYTGNIDLKEAIVIGRS